MCEAHNLLPFETERRRSAMAAKSVGKPRRRASRESREHGSQRLALWTSAFTCATAALGMATALLILLHAL